MCSGPPLPNLPAHHGPHLSAPPAVIVDKYSSVLGDTFHFMDRPKVSTHHEVKKAYFVSLRDAWFLWNPMEPGEAGHGRHQPARVGQVRG